MLNYTAHYRKEIAPFPLEDELLVFVESLSNAQLHKFLSLFEKLTETEVMSFLHRLQSAFRRHWTRFNLYVIQNGLCIMLSSVVLLLNSASGKTEHILLVSLLVTSLLLLKEYLILLATFFSLFTTFVLVLRLLLYIPFRSIFLVIIVGVAYFSNSFLVNEVHVTVYAIQTILFYCLVRRIFDLQKTHLRVMSQFVFLMFGARISIFLENCREESFISSGCRLANDSWIVKPLDRLTVEEFRTSGIFRLFVCVSLLFAVLSGYRQWLKRTRNQRTATWYLVTLMGSLLVCCWISGVIAEPLFDTSQTVRVRFAHALLFSILVFFLYLVDVHSLLIDYGIPVFSNPVISAAGCSAVSWHELDHYLDCCLDWMVSVFLVIPVAVTCTFLNETYLPCVVLLPLAVFLFSHSLNVPRCNPVLVSSWQSASFFVLVDNLSFYITGHQPTIVAIPWTAAFSAYSGNHETRWLPALMVIIHLYAGSILVASTMPIVVFYLEYVSRLRWISSKYSELQSVDGQALAFSWTAYASTLYQLFGRFLTCKALLTTFCSFGTALLRRHLMVWKIFAPRLLFSAVSILVSTVILLVVWVIAVHCFQSVTRKFLSRFHR